MALAWGYVGRVIAQGRIREQSHFLSAQGFLPGPIVLLLQARVSSCAPGNLSQSSFTSNRSAARPGLWPAISGLALGLALVTCAPSARANVYATNIKLNGELINATAAQGGEVTISYILNDRLRGRYH